MYERDVANLMLTKHWAGRTLPVDPFQIALAEGLNVTVLDSSDYGASGWYRVVQGRPTIQFNPSEPYLRQRFTVAHELGHHLLQHGERPRDAVSAMGIYSSDAFEVQANRFAAELLMPAGSVQLLVVDNGVTDVSVLADQFQVSEVAMRYRLKNLGYI